MPRRLFHFSLVLPLLWGCASAKLDPSHEVLNGDIARFVFVPHRQLEMEPCGCTMAQLGGVDKELNYLISVRRRRPLTYLFSAGRSFLPRADSKIPSRHVDLKRKALIKALNVLGLSALGLSAQDASLSPREMLSLAEKADFPFISTNLVPKDPTIPWKRFHWVEMGNRRVFVVALSAATKQQLPSDWLLHDPLKAVQDVIREQSAEPDLIVLLSDLPQSQSETLAAKIPHLRIVLGSNDLESTPEDTGLLLNPSTLFTNSLSSGRGVSWVEFELAPRGVFYNRQHIESLQSYGRLLKARLEEANAKPRLSVSERKDRDGTRSTLEHVMAFPKDYAEGMIRFNAGAERMTPDWSNPSNALTKQIEALRERIRELAIDSIP